MALLALVLTIYYSLPCFSQIFSEIRDQKRLAEYLTEIIVLEKQGEPQDALCKCQQAFDLAKKLRHDSLKQLQKQMAELYFLCGKYQESYDYFAQLNKQKSSAINILRQVRAELAMGSYPQALNLLKSLSKKQLALDTSLQQEFDVYSAAVSIMLRVNQLFGELRLQDIQNGNYSLPEQFKRQVEILDRVNKTPSGKISPVLMRQARFYFCWACLVDPDLRSQARNYLDNRHGAYNRLAEIEARGILDYCKNNYAAALMHFDRCIATMPWTARFYYYRAQTRLRQSPNSDLIIDDCIQALRLQPWQLLPMKTLYANILKKSMFEKLSLTNIINSRVLARLNNEVPEPSLWNEQNQKLAQSYLTQSQQRQIIANDSDFLRKAVKLAEHPNGLDFLAGLWGIYPAKISESIKNNPRLSPLSKQQLIEKLKAHYRNHSDKYRIKELKINMARFFSFGDIDVFLEIGKSTQAKSLATIGNHTHRDKTDEYFLYSILEDNGSPILLRYWAAQTLAELRSSQAYYYLLLALRSLDGASRILAQAVLISSPIATNHLYSNILEILAGYKSVRQPSLNLAQLQKLSQQLQMIFLWHSSGKLPARVYYHFLNSKNAQIALAATRGLVELLPDKPDQDNGYNETRIIASLDKHIGSYNENVRVYASYLLYKYFQKCKDSVNKNAIAVLQKLVARPKLGAKEVWMVSRILITNSRQGQQQWHKQLRDSLSQLLKTKDSPEFRLPIYVMQQKINPNSLVIQNLKSAEQLVILGHWLFNIRYKLFNEIQLLSPMAIKTAKTVCDIILNSDIESLFLYLWSFPEFIDKGPYRWGVRFVHGLFAKLITSSDESRRMIAGQMAFRVVSKDMLLFLQRRYCQEPSQKVKDCLAVSIVYLALYFGNQQLVSKMEESHPLAAAYAYYRGFEQRWSIIRVDYFLEKKFNYLNLYGQLGLERLHWGRLDNFLSILVNQTFSPKFFQDKRRWLQQAARKLVANDAHHKDFRSQLARQVIEITSKNNISPQELKSVQKFFLVVQLDYCWRRVRRATKLAPQVAQYFFEAAFILKKMGEYDTAKNYLSHAIELSPLPLYYLLAAQLEYHLGRFDQASGYLAKLRQIGINDAELWELQGQIYLKRGKWEQACGCFERCYLLCPHDPIGLALLAHARLNAGADRRQIHKVVKYLSEIKISTEGIMYAWMKFSRLAAHDRLHGTLQFILAQLHLPDNHQQALDHCRRGEQFFSDKLLYYSCSPFTYEYLQSYSSFKRLLQNRQLFPLKIIGFNRITNH